VNRALSLPLRALVVLLGALFAGGALGDPPEEGERFYGSFRAGLPSDPNTPPVLCAELAPVSWLSVEGCGNGSGFLHEQPIPELAHFRAKLRLYQVQRGAARIEPLLGIGYAELQLGADDAGFDFGAVNENQLSTAGPELSAGLRLRYLVGKRLEAVGELSAQGAYLLHAPELAQPQSAFQPSFGVTFGIGF
jgi:hypothetical protein